MKNHLIFIFTFISVVVYCQESNYYLDSTKCYFEVKKLVPDKCLDVKETYGTIISISKKYYSRCELLTYLPKSRPVGWAAYKLASSEKFAGYWAIGYGWFDSIEEANKMSELLKTQYPEFCTCFGTEIPIWSERFKYIESTIPITPNTGQ